MRLIACCLSLLMIWSVSGCDEHRAAKVPMDAIYDVERQPADGRIMLIMLPGVKDRPEDLVQHGFMRALRERKLPVDVAAVDAHLGYYLERNFIVRLNEDIIAPARAKGYKRIWLMGISLGGMGSLIYAREFGAQIEGVMLLAPFLGTRGTIAEVARAGGFEQWQAGAVKPDDDERSLLAWLKEYQPSNRALPRIWLGYGQDDRFAPASELLAQRLPAAQVLAIAGGHDWATWIDLWQRLLTRDPFSGTQSTAGARQASRGTNAE
jgi:pimeloyl-ACP methyl ester carboxylesterase